LTVTQSPIVKEVLERLLDAEKLKNCYECGICTASCPMVDLMGKDYNPRILLEKIFLNPESVLSSEALWLCAWCYRCQKRCNQALKLPEIFLVLRRIAADNGYLLWSEKAMQKIVENIPLPLVTTLVCFHPERVNLDIAKVLDKIEQMHGEYLRKEKARRAQEVAEEKVAIVGSGPAGLTVAYELSRKGYGVTIFEALAEVGGMLRKCIPDFRLPKRFLEKEITNLKDLGIEIKTNEAIGEDFNFVNLSREGYKAIFIGIGAHKAQKLDIEGVNLKGVVHALDFLWKINSGEKIEVG